MSNNIFSYTKRDYEGSRKEGLAKIPQLSRGVWTDLNASDPGIIILDYVHALVDMINYYQDHQAMETFITTAKERANIFRLAKQLSYKVISAKSAQVEVVFSSDFSYDYSIKIPQYTKVSTRDGINYYTTKDAYLGAGEADVSVSCKQGNFYEQIYHGTGLSRLSAVEPPFNVNQSVVLTAPNIDTDSISIKDNLGRVWTPVDFVVFSTEIDRVFQVDLNPDNTVTIKFGDGERGIVPSETDELTISYLVTNADKGRVAANSIVETAPVYYEGKYIEFTVNNPVESVGGYAPQSSRSIRELAPGAIKAAGRAVTLSDFENLAKLVPGVKNAIAYDINIDSTITVNEVRLMIIPEDSYNASNHLLIEDVKKYISPKMIPPTTLVVATPTDIILDIPEVIVRGMISDKGAIEYEIETTIREYFTSISDDLGETFYPTDLAAIIRNIPSVRAVDSVIVNPVDPNIIVDERSKAITIPDLSRAKLGQITLISVI